MSAAVAGTIPGLNGELHHYYRLDRLASGCRQDSR